MHHTMHVLDAPGNKCYLRNIAYTITRFIEGLPHCLSFTVLSLPQYRARTSLISTEFRCHGNVSISCISVRVSMLLHVCVTACVCVCVSVYVYICMCIS